MTGVKVGDVYRLPAYGGGYRVWKVAAILLGGLHQEGVIELQTLDRLASEDGRLLVPVEILDAAKLERV